MEAFRSPRRTMWVWTSGKLIGEKKKKKVSIMDDHFGTAQLVLQPPVQQHYRPPEVGGPPSPCPGRGGDGRLFIPAA